MDPPPKLDMRHGFVRSILKNQIDRDEYDKNERLKVVQEKLDRKERPKRKSQAVYVPPHLRGSRTATTNDASKQEEEEDVSTDSQAVPRTRSSPAKARENKVILKLQFEKEDGNTIEMALHQDDDMRETVKSFALKNGLDERLKDALYHRVKQALRGSRSN